MSEQARGQWGLAMPHGSLEWEGNRTASRHYQSTPQAADNTAPSKVLLYGPKGEALIRQEPRAIGFRQR